MATTGAPVSWASGHGFAHVIAMAVGHQDQIHRPHLVHRGLEQGVAEPGVDEHRDPGRGQFKGRVAQEGDAHPSANYCFGHDFLRVRRAVAQRRLAFVVR